MAATERGRAMKASDSGDGGGRHDRQAIEAGDTTGRRWRQHIKTRDERGGGDGGETDGQVLMFQ
jgi:hypothetical protein